MIVSNVWTTLSQDCRKKRDGEHKKALEKTFRRGFEDMGLLTQRGRLVCDFCSSGQQFPLPGLRRAYTSEFVRPAGRTKKEVEES